MKFQAKRNTLLVAALFSTVLFSQVASADEMLSTGGYAREMHKIEMMNMLDANGDHMVSLDEFNQYYAKLYEALDKDKNGKIDATEWVGDKKETGISIATGGYTRELRKMEMMSKVDSDGDHTVSKDEFVTYHQSLFKGLDKSGDKQIDPQEWLAKQTGNK